MITKKALYILIYFIATFVLIADSSYAESDDAKTSEIASRGKFVSAYCFPTKGFVYNYKNENVYLFGVAGGFVGKMTRCMHSTVKNMFYGGQEIFTKKDGDNRQQILYKCIGSKEQVKDVSECRNGLFVSIRDATANIVSVILIMYFTFQGVRLVVSQEPDAREAFDDSTGQYLRVPKIIVRICLILGIILYFVRGNAWSDGYLDFVLNVATDLGELLLGNNIPAIFSSLSEEQLANPNTLKSISNITSCLATNLENIRDKGVDFPAGSLGPQGIYYASSFERSFRVWDMLDCRINNMISFVWNVEHENKRDLVSFLINGLFGLALIIIMAVFIIFMLAHLSFSLIYTFFFNLYKIFMLVIISPLIIPLCLFSGKAGGIFNKWLKKLASHSMVPFVLIALMLFLFNVFDYLIYGVNFEAVFNIDSVGRISIKPDCDIFSLICFFKGGQAWWESYAVVVVIIKMFFTIWVSLLIYFNLMGPLVQGLTGAGIEKGNALSSAAIATKNATVSPHGAAGNLINNIASKIKGY